MADSGSFSLAAMIAAGIGAFGANFAAEFVKWIVRRAQARGAERDADLIEVINTVDALCAFGKHYWVASAADLGSERSVVEGQILAGQHHIGELIIGIFGESALKHDCDIALIRLMNALTGDAFGGADRPAQPERMVEVYLASSRLKHECRKARRKLGRKVFE